MVTLVIVRKGKIIREERGITRRAARDISAQYRGVKVFEEEYM